MRGIRTTGFRVRGSAGGFTLIEVLTSIAIIGVILPVLLYATDLASSAAAVARNRTRATTLAQQKLDDLLVNGPIQNGSDEFGDEAPGFKWEAVVNTFNSPTVDGLTTTIEELDVTVTWQQQGQPRNLTLGTLVYNNGATTSGGLP